MLRGPWSRDQAVTHWRGSADAADALTRVPGSSVPGRFTLYQLWAQQHGQSTGLSVISRAHILAILHCAGTQISSCSLLSHYHRCHYELWDVIPRHWDHIPVTKHPKIGSLLHIAHRLSGKGGRRAAGERQAWKQGGSHRSAGTEPQVFPATAQAASPAC